MRTLTICGTPIAAYTIVIPAVADPVEVRAAEFLQRVIHTSCGVTLPISAEKTAHSIVLGAAEPCSEIRYDGFRTATDEANLYLHGNKARGTLFAAYDFAETYLGYRYFADDCIVISTEGEADVPAGLDRIDNPGFSARRTTCDQHVHSAEFSSFSRLNDCTPGGGEGYGGVEPANGDCHSFYRLCPPKEYFEEHPEYYALFEGQRVPCEDSAGPGQLCLTNPDVLRIVTENVLKDLREHPEKKIAEVSQCDNQRYCRCERCAAIDAEEESPSGTMIRFVNAVAEAVEKEFPDVMVRTFAYQYTTKPPKYTKARHNVLVRYCTMGACFRHALDDPHCAINSVKYGKELADWGKMADHLSVWDYVTFWWCFAAPFPNLASLRENARVFYENNAIHLFEESNAGTNGGLNPELRAYLIGKLLWNPLMSAEEYEGHINDFLSHFYGKGWGEIRRVIDLLQEVTAHRCVSCEDDVDIGSVPYQSTPEVPGLRLYLWENYVPKAYQPTLTDHHLMEFIEHLPEIKEMYDRAYALAETDAERKHLDISRYAVTYVDLFVKPHVKAKMTAEERQAYEAEVEQFYLEKERLGARYHLWTSNFQHR